MTKTLLTIGDSWTDSEYISYNNPTRPRQVIWAEQLADRLGYNLINLGRQSIGNERIMKLGVDYLRDHTPDLVCVMLSEQHRVDWYGHLTFHPLCRYLGMMGGDDDQPLNEDWVYKQMIQRNGDTYVADELYRNVFLLQNIADIKGIPIYFSCGVSPWPLWLYRQEEKWSGNYRKFLERVIESSYFEYFERRGTDNLIGWPFFKGLGGYAFTDILNPHSHRISATDKHPSQLGHEVITNEFLKKIKI